MYPSKTCNICKRSSADISNALGVCASCLESRFSECLPYIETIHSETRQAFDLPVKPPRHPDGVTCNLCVNECVICERGRGYCGIRRVQDGHLVHDAGTPQRGLLHWYRDPLLTNCVADWVCEGSNHPGYHNLAVFYKSCTANCLFCQNWHFRESSCKIDDMLSAEELASQVNPRTFCVCYFGGDPSSQMPHALAASKHIAERGVRICWETNGLMNPKLLNAAVKYSYSSGGCIKFDIKAYDDEVHKALTGVSNRRVMENFALAASEFDKRPKPPLVIASTLLVPGYVDAEQVAKIAVFIASINPGIPYSLLAFGPNFYMSDMPCTTTSHAREAEAAAYEAGLRNVHVGNRHMLDLDIF